MSRRRFTLRAAPLAELEALGPETSSLSTFVFDRPADLVPRDWALLLLQNAAEVEHALMVQYLFAAYSLRTDPATPALSQWRVSILSVAREEMGHLLTIQNLLRLVGGAPCLEREDFPLRSQFYPFPFTLERLTKDSLAKYVFAEMTSEEVGEPVLPAVERQEIETRARNAVQQGGGTFTNHVGTLYLTLIDVFRTLDPSDFRPDRQEWLSESTDWSGTVSTTATLKGIKLFAPLDRSAAVQALTFIARQGEASAEAGSHFHRFLTIYRAFPDASEGITWPVRTNPTLNEDFTSGSLITNPTTRLWGQLFNLRYRIVLTVLAHASAVSNTTKTADGTLVRDVMRRWLYEEMLPDAGSLRALAAERLATLPAADSVEETAGAPFDLPYSLQLPDLEPDRWRLHLDLVNASRTVTEEIRKLGADDFIEAIATRDDTSREIILANINQL